ncbi:MAG: chemotaxis protein CheA [Myxococcaceae bacterium]
MSSKGLSDFIAEATEVLDVLSRDLLELDEHRGEEPDPDRINSIFRAAHSIKGLAGMFGQDRMAALAHHSEDLLDRLRLGKVPLSDAVLDSLIETLDVLQALLAELSRSESSEALTSRAKQLGDRLSMVGSEPPPAPADELDSLELDAAVRAVFTEYEEHRLRENIRRGLALFKVRAAFDLSDFDQGLAALNAKLKPLGEVISTLPSAEPGGGTGIAFDLIFGTKRPESELTAAVEGMPVRVSAIHKKGEAPAPAPAKPAGKKRGKKKTEPEPPIARGTPQPPEPSPVPRSTVDAQRSTQAPRSPETPIGAERSTIPDDEPDQIEAPEGVHVTALPTSGQAPRPRAEFDTSLRSLTQTVRVDIRRLDALMNAVGELLLIKANVQRLADSAQAGGSHNISKLWGQELGRESRQLERKLDELQSGILDVRMVPLGQVFDKLARLVRRIAREAGKEIDFAITGEEVELDKLIVEELSDPLMHLIRNSIDHGVESPNDRVDSGKLRRGTISLSARQQGNHVVVEVKDDGAGIDERRVREVAISRGLLTSTQADELGRRELLNLIFLPGFSTAKNVSELSGRGVGLDVVKNNIANLSGIIDVQSERGRGTTFTLTLPLTLAIIRALVVSVSERTYAVPLNSVLEIISVETKDIRTVERREVVDLRGQTLQLVRLARLFQHNERPLQRMYVVVVGLAQERLGIAVDELLGQQDIVTKPLGGRLQGLRGISGATDLGNRRTVLVLDVGALMEEVILGDRRAEVI